MRKSFRGKKTNNNLTKQFRANERIFAREVMLIGEQGEKIGIISRDEALRRAREADLDLVEVSPKAEPPICKILDYGSFKYQRDKAEKKQKSKQKTSEMKTVKISARISQHDLEVRIKNAIKFLIAGDKVKIELQLKGRENKHGELAKESINKMIEKIKEKTDKEIKTEQDVARQGNRLSAVISVK